MTKILNTTTLTFLQETTFIFYTIAFGWIMEYGYQHVQQVIQLYILSAGCSAL